MLLTWLYLSAYILIMGAELNAELEHQTAADTTAGPAQPLGTRGAEAADTVAGVPGGGSESGARAADASTVDDIATAGIAPPSPTRELVAGREVARAGAAAGLPRLGLAPASLATADLALVRKPGRAAAGAAIVAAATALAWLQREAPSASKE